MLKTKYKNGMALKINSKYISFTTDFLKKTCPFEKPRFWFAYDNRSGLFYFKYEAKEGYEPVKVSKNWFSLPLGRHENTIIKRLGIKLIYEPMFFNFEDIEKIQYVPGFGTDCYCVSLLECVDFKKLKEAKLKMIMEDVKNEQ